MIISHKHKYLFVELPLTGSTAIAEELIEHYSGERILQKHSTYEDFLRWADGRWAGYFVFSGIRHPLDQAVSHFAKLKSDHKGKISTLSSRRRARGLHFIAHWWSERRKFDFIKAGRGDFDSYFCKFYRLPYSNWSIVSHRKFDAVIRFESLAQDFENVLVQIGISPVRPLPIRNRSQGKSGWESYFETDQARRRAVRLFWPFMRYWQYEFPAGWNVDQRSLPGESGYRLVNFFRKLYWLHFRYRF